jgi:hypothetical protein
LRKGSKQQEDLLSIAKLGKGKKAKGRSSFHCKTWEEKRAEARLILFLSQTWEGKKN